MVRVRQRSISQDGKPSIRALESVLFGQHASGLGLVARRLQPVGEGLWKGIR